MLAVIWFVVSLACAAVVFAFLSKYKQRSRDQAHEHKEQSCVILYGSQTGGGAKNSQQLLQRFEANGFANVRLVNMKDYEVENLWKEQIIIVIISTYEDGKPPNDAQWFCCWLQESACDFRVGASALKHAQFAVFGRGSSNYDESRFNSVAKQVQSNFIQLGATQLAVTLADEDASISINEQFFTWQNQLIQSVLQQSLSNNKNEDQNYQGNKLQQSDAKQSAQQISEKKYVEAYLSEDEYDDGDEEEEEEEDDDVQEDEEKVVDMEDLGGKYNKLQNGKQKTGPKEMVTPVIRSSLTKQGYKIIGSHSGVKLCRWTKSMLRGRGGCYKHTFYGIESHRCMAATPSLACANKCVFCWRHHTNPVGKEWKWAMDDHQTILNGALQNHYKMINEYRGVPGVKAERLSEGLQAKHCALSLVGEPIMYPEINQLIDALHAKSISTFLVTNAQFPDQIASLRPVTQLYVSVDAATKDSLKAVDRPLFADFWERFITCLQLLTDKAQRTVYRLTLVKQYNMEDVQQYAKLVGLGQPDFIEVKGVTYCGSSNASDLTMKNVPFHEEVRNFCKALCESVGGQYDLACEHEHSCCILIANKSKFLQHGRWHTWIDYDKFQELVQQGDKFTSNDYMLETPLWATFGAPEAGFDPQETRFKKIRKHHNKT
eukprot:TRINITY_DN12051_c0_g1_i1.p1 TRINITY_DN12051_c0_g1~~TRINITY_DN12051_c0_g1_i1.p1  ORF type:complete len:659 (-),score=98.37 TRINITY_DN12051_c0_g1_i1:343-2319(-)